jgi:hypothetical protein
LKTRLLYSYLGTATAHPRPPYISYAHTRSVGPSTPLAIAVHVQAM